MEDGNDFISSLETTNKLWYAQSYCLNNTVHHSDKKTSLSIVLPTRKYVRDSHNHSERQVLHNVFTSCLVGTRGTTNSSSMQADIHLCQSRLVLTSKLGPCWMRVGTTCQANFPQVSHCLSNSLTDLTDMQSKFANCNMQWQGKREREERVQTKGG